MTGLHPRGVFNAAVAVLDADLAPDHAAFCLLYTSDAADE